MARILPAMRKRWSSRLAIVLCTLAVVIPWETRTGVASGDRAPVATGLRNVHFNALAPDFRYDIGSGPQRLGDTRGKPVVLNFWATWCGPCVDELPVFDRLRRTFGERVEVVSVSDEAAGVARAFAAARGSLLPVAEDPQRLVFDAYSIGPIPVTVVLDAGGLVTHVSVGELDWDELSSAVQADLSMPMPAATSP